MKPGELFNAKVGAVCVVMDSDKARRPDMRWAITHHERIRGGAVRSVIFYAPTRTEVIDNLIRSNRRLPKDADIQFQS